MKTIALLKKDLSPLGGLEKQTRRIQNAFEDAGCAVSILPNTHKNHTCAYDIVLGIDRALYQTHLRAGNGVHAAYLTRRPFHKKWMPKHRCVLRQEKKALKQSTLRHIITNSEMVRQEYMHFYNIDPEKITTIHNGVEWDELEKPFHDAQNKSSAPYHFLFIGNDLRRKGLLPLMHALAHLRKEEWKLTIIGSDKSIGSFMTLAKALDIDQKTHFAGKQTNPIPYYAKADCLVLPTFYDPFANVTLEALAMGLFIITSPYNGAKEILTPETGTVSVAGKPLKEACYQALKSARNPTAIRGSVKHLDFQNQLHAFTHLCLTT